MQMYATNTTPIVTLTLHVANAWFNHVCVKRILCIHRTLQPCDQDIQLRTSYEQTVRNTVTNYNDTLDNLQYNDVLRESSHILDNTIACDCLLYAPQYAQNDKTANHVMTTSPSEILDKGAGDKGDNGTGACNLRRLFSAGSKLRQEPRCTSSDTALDCLQYALDNFDEQYSSDNSDIPYNSNMYPEWRHAVVLEFSEQVQIMKARSNIDYGSPMYVCPIHVHGADNPEPFKTWTGPTKSALVRLHNRTVVVDIDKTTHSVIAVCWKLYAAKTVTVLHTANDYIRVNTDVYEIHKALCSRLIPILHPKHYAAFYNHIFQKFMKVAAFHLTIKIHKNPYAFRPIADASHCIFTEYHKIASQGLKLVLHTIKSIEQIRYRTAQPPSWWIVSNSIDLLSTLPKHITHLQSYDVEGCFTNVVIENLQHLFRTAMQSILTNSDVSGIFIGYKTAIWRRNTEPTESRSSMHYYSIGAFLQLLDVVADEFYVQACNAIFKMTCGVPMGGHAASECADLYLAMQEITFMHRIENTHPAMFRALSNMRRFRDDILSVNNPLFHKVWKHIYSPDMQLTTDSDEGTTCIYLDIKFEIYHDDTGNIKWKSVPYDKWEGKTFSPIKFPDLRSNMLVSQAYECVSGELYRLAHISTLVEDFVHSTARMIWYLVVKRHYSFPRLHTTVNRFICKHSHLFDMDVARRTLHAHPLYTRARLCRHAGSGRHCGNRCW